MTQVLHAPTPADRIVMAPMTRTRANETGLPTDRQRDYDAVFNKLDPT